MKALALVLSIGFASTLSAATSYQFDWMNHAEQPRIAKFTMGEENDKVYVIEAWFNGCPYCHINAPKVDELAEALSDDSDITVIDLGRDRRDSDYMAWINRHKPNHPVVRDGQGDQSLINRLGIRAYPTTMVLDCNLNVLHSKLGTWEDADFQAILEKARQASASTCVVN